MYPFGLFCKPESVNGIVKRILCYRGLLATRRRASWLASLTQGRVILLPAKSDEKHSLLDAVVEATVGSVS